MKMTNENRQVWTEKNKKHNSRNKPNLMNQIFVSLFYTDNSGNISENNIM